jgi:hypothetical protein
LALNSDTGEFVVEAELDAAQPGQFQPVQADLNRKQRLAHGIRFGTINIRPVLSGAVEPRGQAHAVTFEPLGTADAAVIEVTDGTRSWSLRIAPSTGRAELVKGLSRQWLEVRIDLDA